MKKGVSPIISTVLLIFITISAAFIVMNIAKPTVERAYEAALINEVDQNMQLLDNLIREVASEGVGSMRSFVLKVSDGDYRVVNASGIFTGAFQFKTELKHSPFSPLMFKKVGNLKYTAGMNVIGLIGYWNLNEGSGNITYDSSGYNHHGSFSTPTGPIWIDGKYGKALSFDGADDVVTINNSPNFNFSIEDRYTIEVWVKLGENTTIARSVIVEKSQTSGPYPFALRANPYIGVEFTISNETHLSSVSYINPLQKDVWYHFVGVKDGNTLKIYVNGILQNSTTITITGDIANDDNLFLGRKGDGDIPFNGTIDEVRIYNKALSREEIKENYDTKASNYQAVLEYNKIILTGTLRFGKGTHKICIEKIGESNNKPLVKITTC